MLTGDNFVQRVYVYAYADAFWLYAVWRHVLGADDVIDKIDIALGKCKCSSPYLKIACSFLALLTRMS